MNLVFLFINMDTINTAIHTELATKIAKEYKYISIKGRYITINDIEKFLLKLTNSSRVSFKKIGESEENRNIYQIKTGKGKKKILIVTDSPTATEDAAGNRIPNSMVVSTLKQFGIDILKDCWVSSAVLCRPPKGRAPKAKEVDVCSIRMRKLISKLKPEKIITFGKLAIESILAVR